MMRWGCVLVALASSLMMLAPDAAAEERVHRIGVLTTSELSGSVMNTWLEGLRERGWVIGRNLQIEYRFTAGRTDRIPALAAELAALAPELIVAAAAAPALAVRATAPQIPLVFVNLGDPVGLGLVESVAHPGGNATGFANIVPEGFAGKGFQLLKEMVPRAVRMASLINPLNPLHRQIQGEFSAIGQRLAVGLIVLEASRSDQFEQAFEAASKQGAESINVLGDPIFFVGSATILSLAARYRLPALYFFRQSVLDGGLMSFGPDPADHWRRVPAYVDKILKGERPADLPVQQPTKYHLSVNLKTAAVLGLTVPPAILAQADEVIE